MGNSNQKNLKETDKEIDEKLKEDENDESKWNGLLLLGPGESGKSTLMKQMRQLWGTQFLQEERKSYRDRVWQNIIESMQKLCKYSIALEKIGVEGCNVNEKNENDLKAVLQLSSDSIFDKDTCQKFKNLWDDEGIKKTYDNRHRFYLMDNAWYLFKHMERFVGEDYVPTFEDICHTRGRTTGIVTEMFSFKNAKFRVYDVGGQRTERKKWLGTFDNVEAIVYVMSLIGYTQVIFEDNKTNVFDETIGVYEQCMTFKSLLHTNIILLLNKYDLFEKEINKIPFKHEKYKNDGKDKQKAIQFMIGMFEERTPGIKSKQGRKVYPHVTCATDTENIRKVFQDIQHILLKKTMNASGLLYE